MELENEVMNYEDVMVNEEIEAYDMEPETENSGMSTVLAMAIGAGLTAATTAAVMFGKKLWAKYKAKKETESEPVEEHDFVIPTDEEIEAVKSGK